MARRDVLDVTITNDLKVGERVDLKIISDAELRVKCVDDRLRKQSEKDLWCSRAVAIAHSYTDGAC
jgi:hypothetical protein